MSARLSIGTRLNNYSVRVVVVAHDDGSHIACTEGQVEPARVYIEDGDLDLWTIVPSDADREVEALRRQVAELQAERDALQAACVCAGCGARDGTCDEDGLCDGCGCDVIVGSIGAVEAVERLREERESYESELSDVREGLHTVTAQRDRLALDATLEAEALRRQVAELTALGVSLHKAADRGRKEERATIVAWLRGGAEAWLYVAADGIERGLHEKAP